MIEIIHEEFDDRGIFRAEENGVKMGEMTYFRAGGNAIAIDHTGVPPEFSGKGVGKMLVMGAVDYARCNDVKIIPICSYVRHTFERNDEIKDVLSA